MTLQIDTLAYTNRLRQVPPGDKLVFAIALLLLSNIAARGVQCLIALWVALWIVGYARIPAATYGKLLAIPLGFWGSSLPVLVIGSAGIEQMSAVQSDIWYGFTGHGGTGGMIVWGNYMLYLSRQGLQQAVDVGLRAIAATSCLYFIFLTIPVIELVQILRRCHCPTLLTDLLLLMYRFIFTVLRTARELRTAQFSRNGYRTWKLSMSSLGILVGQLLQRTLIHYRQISLSLAARGFAGDLRVWHSRHYVRSRRYCLEALIGYAVLLGVTGWSHAIGI